MYCIPEVEPKLGKHTLMRLGVRLSFNLDFYLLAWVPGAVCHQGAGLQTPPRPSPALCCHPYSATGAQQV